MRLLTTDELLVVSGGYINGEHDPRLDSAGGSGSGTSTVAFFCEKIVNQRKQDDCWLTAANTASCPGGWDLETERAKLGSDGVSFGSKVVKCKTDNSSDSGSDDSNSCSSGGSDSGKDD